MFNIHAKNDPWNRVLLEKVICTLIEKYNKFYVTNLITVFTAVANDCVFNSLNTVYS
jgi:hypothetical protein